MYVRTGAIQAKQYPLGRCLARDAGPSGVSDLRRQGIASRRRGPRRHEQTRDSVSRFLSSVLLARKRTLICLCLVLAR